MKIEHYLSLEYYESQADKIKEAVINAYLSGYRKGAKGNHKIMIDGVIYCDLELPSENLWSNRPVHKSPPGCHYHHYVLKTYNEVSKLNLPTVEDFEEIINKCTFTFEEETRQKGVNICGKNGQILKVETSNHINRPEVPNSHYVVRKEKDVPKGINMVWLKSEVHDNKASVAVVDFINKKLYVSTYDVNLKLAYFLIK